MAMHNPTNERIKRQYFAFLKEAKRQSEATVRTPSRWRWLGSRPTLKFRDFRAFHFEQAIGFKRRIAEQQSRATGRS